MQATDSQEATLSVWGAKAQAELVRTRVGVVGLGSVGSIVAEALSRIGLNDLIYIDFDKIEPRNLDRTMGASNDEVEQLKVRVAASNSRHSSTALNLTLKEIPYSLLTPDGPLGGLGLRCTRVLRRPAVAQTSVEHNCL